MKKIEGYVRSIPGGDPVGSVPVTIIDKFTNLPVPVGGVQGGSTNPISTDGDGHFLWTCELSPGPVRAEADVSGTEVKVRDGSEVMQAGSFFLSDLGELFLAFSTGILTGVLDAFSATPAGGTRQVTLGTGRAFMIGLPFGIDSDRVYTFDANGTVATRHDLIVARQWISGDREGRQSIEVVKGTLNGVDPTINTDPEILEQAWWRVKIANGASVVTVEDMRVYAGVSALPNPLAVGGQFIQTISANGAFTIEQADGTDLVRVDTLGSNKNLIMANGTRLLFYSDNGSAETFRIDASTGNVLVAGVTLTPTILSYLSTLSSNVQTQLNGKAATAHTHAESDITNLVADLAAKAAAANSNLTGTTAIAGTIDHNGTLVGFYGAAPVVKGAALTPISTAVVGATWGAGEQAVVDSTRSAVNDLELRLQALGLIN